MGFTVNMPTSGLLGIAGAQTFEISTDTTAVANRIYILQTSTMMDAGEVVPYTVTLPAAGLPNNPGDRLILKRLGTTNVNIVGSFDRMVYTTEEPFVIEDEGAGLVLVYSDDDNTWLLESSGATGGGGESLAELSDTRIVAPRRHQRITFAGTYWQNNLGNLFTTNRFGDVVEIVVNDDGTTSTIIRNAAIISDITPSVFRAEAGSSTNITFTVNNYRGSGSMENPSVVNNPVAYRFTRTNEATGELVVLMSGDITDTDAIPDTFTDNISPASAGGNYTYNLEVDDDDVNYPSTGYAQNQGVRGVRIEWYSTPMVSITTAAGTAQSSFTLTANVTDADQESGWSYLWFMRALNAPMGTAFTPITGEINPTYTVTTDGDYQVRVTDRTNEEALAPFVGIDVNESPAATISGLMQGRPNLPFTLTLGGIDTNTITALTLERALLTNGNPGTFSTVALTPQQTTDALAAFNAGMTYDLSVTLPDADMTDQRYRLTITDQIGATGTAQHDIRIVDILPITGVTGTRTTFNSFGGSGTATVMGSPGAEFTIAYSTGTSGTNSGTIGAGGTATFPYNVASNQGDARTTGFTIRPVADQSELSGGFTGTLSISQSAALAAPFSIRHISGGNQQTFIASGLAAGDALTVSPASPRVGGNGWGFWVVGGRTWPNAVGFHERTPVIIDSVTGTGTVNVVVQFGRRRPGQNSSPTVFITRAGYRRASATGTPSG